MSCVDQETFITYVNQNTRDCAWVEKSGKCDKYGSHCPVTCKLCNVEVDSEQDAEQNTTDLQSMMDYNVDLEWIINQDTSYNSSSTVSDEESHVMVDLSITTLSAEQRQQIMNGKLSMELGGSNLVTATDILSGSGDDNRIFEAIVMSVSQVLDDETGFVVSDDPNDLTSLDLENQPSNVVAMAYSPGYASSIVEDGSNGWIQVHIPYKVLENSSSHRLLKSESNGTIGGESTFLEQIGEACNLVVQKRIADGTLLEMLQLSDSRIQAVSVDGHEDVGDVVQPDGINGISIFAIVFIGIVCLGALIFWAHSAWKRIESNKNYWTNKGEEGNVHALVEKGESAQSVYPSKTDPDPNNTLETDLSSKRDSSALPSDPRSRASSESHEQSGPNLASAAGSSVASGSSFGIGLRDVGIVNGPLPPSIVRRPSSTIEYASISSAPSFVTNSDRQSSSGSIFEKLRRASRAKSTSNLSYGSSWGDELVDDVHKVDETIFGDGLFQNEISRNSSIHCIDIKGEEYDWCPRDQANDEEFDALYNSPDNNDMETASTSDHVGKTAAKKYLDYKESDEGTEDPTNNSMFCTPEVPLENCSCESFSRAFTGFAEETRYRMGLSDHTNEQPMRRDTSGKTLKHSRRW